MGLPKSRKKLQVRGYRTVVPSGGPGAPLLAIGRRASVLAGPNLKALPSAFMSARILVVDDSATIRRVVCDILERRGYEIVLAGDGLQALEAIRKQPVDLALVDFVMPQMNGFQFCRALRIEPGRGQTPVVLISAKSDRIRERFVEQTFAVDALAKPFDARALVAVVENALLRSLRGVSESIPPMTDDEFLAPESTVPPPADDQGEATTRFRVAGLLVLKIAERLRGFAELSEDELIAELATRIPPAVARDIFAHVRESEGGVLLSGTLHTIPLSAVLQMISVEQLSGQLVLSREENEIIASFRNGLVDLVEARGGSDEFRLGRYLVEDGALTRTELEAMLQPPPGRHGGHSGHGGHGGRARTLGDRLLDAGSVAPEALARALLRQSSELVYEVLRWKRGRFEFQKERPRENAERARLGLSVASLVVEGFRRVEEWRHVEAALGSFDAVLIQDPDTHQKLDVAALPKNEQTILAAIDGERSVRSIIKASKLSSFDACRILAQFLGAQIARRRVL
jgi:CheY-like chemotaxis protein